MSDPGGSGRRARVAADAAWAVVPGALTVYLSFESGAFFPGPTGVLALVLLALLLIRVVACADPFAGVGLPLAVAAGAMMLLAALTLASGSWSDAPARALTEFDRTLGYLVALVLFGSMPRIPRRLRWTVWGLAAAMAGVCIAAFITRTMPDVWSAPPDLQRNRLSYPIGYWNALGLMAALALVFCLHLTSSAREPVVVRVLAVAAMPVVGSTLLFTFSRGPLAVGVLGLLAYLVAARPRFAPGGLLAAVPTVAVAVLVSYHANFAADYVKGRGYSALGASGLHEAHRVAATVALCALGAAALRIIGVLVLDRAMNRVHLPPRVARSLAAGTAGVVAVVVAVTLVVSWHDGWIHRQYDRMLSDPVTQTGNYRDRLFNPGLNRLDRWQVAINAFRDSPVKGTGAGTYRLVWERHRPTESNTNNAHSLYLEMAGELGVPGFLLIVVTLLMILGAFGLRARGPHRAVFGALVGAGLTWAVHAALDWDWELPAVTLWLFAAGGLALARAGPRLAPRRVGMPVRIVVGVALVLLAVTPARLALSDQRLSSALRGFRAGDCAEAVRAARSSTSALGSRPEPYQLVGYCQARQGAYRASVRSLAEAVRLDPHNWRYHYGLALSQGLAGIDPRPQAAEAFRLNPREVKARQAVVRLRSHDAKARRRAARRLALGR